MRYLMELFSFDFKHCSPNLIIHKPFFGRVFARYGRAGRFPVAVLFEKFSPTGDKLRNLGRLPLTPCYFQCGGDRDSAIMSVIGPKDSIGVGRCP